MALLEFRRFAVSLLSNVMQWNKNISIVEAGPFDPSLDRTDAQLLDLYLADLADFHQRLVELT